MSLEEELTRACVLRKRSVVPPNLGDPAAPHPEDFNLSSEEKKRVLPEGVFLLSAFVRPDTSPRQVISICANRDPHTVLNFQAEGLRHQPGLETVRMHRDQAGIRDDQKDMPGIAGHCGLTMSAVKAERDAQRLGLAKISRVIQDLDEVCSCDCCQETAASTP